MTQMPTRTMNSPWTFASMRGRMMMRCVIDLVFWQIILIFLQIADLRARFQNIGRSLIEAGEVVLQQVEEFGCKGCPTMTLQQRGFRSSMNFWELCVGMNVVAWVIHGLRVRHTVHVKLISQHSDPIIQAIGMHRQMHSIPIQMRLYVLMNDSTKKHRFSVIYAALLYNK